MAGYSCHSSPGPLGRPPGPVRQISYSRPHKRVSDGTVGGAALRRKEKGEGRRKKGEGGDREAEGRGQRAEVRGHRSGDRGQRSEDNFGDGDDTGAGATSA